MALDATCSPILDYAYHHFRCWHIAGLWQQCTVKPLPLGGTNELVTPYQDPFVPLTQCPQKRNQLNVAAFQSGQYSITRRLFVIVKQDGQSDQQAGVAYANLLLTTQAQELITQAGFVSSR